MYQACILCTQIDWHSKNNNFATKENNTKDYIQKVKKLMQKFFKQSQGAEMDIPKIITQEAYEDFRGFLSVPFDATTSAELDFQIHQINQGYSKNKFTLRGLHFQAQPHAQVKLVYCLHGSIYNVAVDIRPDSSAFGIYYAEFLSFENRKMMYIPKGFAHGYLTLEDDTLMQWCVDEDFCP